jgi:hypothetical protein
MARDRCVLMSPREMASAPPPTSPAEKASVAAAVGPCRWSSTASQRNASGGPRRFTLGRMGLLLAMERLACNLKQNLNGNHQVLWKASVWTKASTHFPSNPNASQSSRMKSMPPHEARNRHVPCALVAGAAAQAAVEQRRTRRRRARSVGRSPGCRGSVPASRSTDQLQVCNPAGQ